MNVAAARRRGKEHFLYQLGIRISASRGHLVIWRNCTMCGFPVTGKTELERGILAKFSSGSEDIDRESGLPAMIIESDLIRTAYELLGPSVRCARSSAVWTFSLTAFVAQW